MATTAAAAQCLIPALLIIISMLLPSAAATTNYTVPDVVQALNASGNFSVFLSIAAKANIPSALQAFIASADTSGATAFIPLDSAFTPDIVSAYGNLSAANQASLLLYHVLPTYYNRSQVVALRNVATFAAFLNNSTTGYRLPAVNQSSDGVITVYASRNAANVSNANISGIPNPPSFPIAIYPIRSVLLPVEIFGRVVPDIVQALNASGNFSVFLSIATKANITSALQAFIANANTGGATAFIPLDSAFTPEIVSAYGNLSAANQANLLLYHVLPTFYNRSQVAALSNVSTLAAVLNNSTTGYRLVAVNQSNDSVITVYGSRNSANVSNANISGIPNPPGFPIAIYPIRSVLLPVEIFGRVPDIVQALNASGNFSIFLSIATKANITSALQAFISSANTSGATAFIPLDSAFTPEIVSAYGSLSAANQANLLLYHVLPTYYNRSQVVALSNVSTLAAVLNNSTAGYRLSAVNQSNDSVITVYASRNSANVSNTNISGIPNPPSFPIAIYPIRSVLLPVEIFPRVPDIVQVLNTSGNFSTFLSIAAKANITSALQAFIGSANTSGATAFIPLDSAFTTSIVSAYGNLSAANQANLLLYHVLPTYYNRSQVITLRNVSTLAAVLNNSTTGYRLVAVNQTTDSVITVYASRNLANVSSTNISGIPNPPSFPIAIYPISSVLLPAEIFP
jgi:uncharacterized protein YjlB